MRKTLAISLAALTLTATSALAGDISTVDGKPLRGATTTAVERLCYVAAEDAPVAYKSEAKRYGVSLHTLKKLEKTVVCGNGVKLGDVENNWVNRNS